MADTFNAGTIQGILRLKDEFSRVLAEAERKVGTVGKQFSGLERQFTAVGKAASVAVTLPLVAAGAALLKLGTEFESAEYTIRAGTGATGDALESLVDDFKAVAREVPSSFHDISTVIADLNTRTGATGEALQGLAKQELNLSRIARTDIQPLIAATTRAFGDWSIASERQAGSLDYLYKVSQTTGIGVQNLTELVVQFGAPLRALGFSFEQSAALMGKFEKEGVNLETVMSGLRYALGQFARAGLDPQKAFNDVKTAILNAKSASEATAIAFKVFGQRAAIDVSRAIVEGRFNIDGLVSSLQGSRETINKADDDTQELGERFAILGHKVAAATDPLGRELVAALEHALDAAQPLFAIIDELITAFSHLPQPVQAVGLTIAGVAAAVGPLALALGQIAKWTRDLLPLLGKLTAAFRVQAAATTEAAVATETFEGVTAITVGSLAGVLAVLGSLALAVRALTGSWKETLAVFVAPPIDGLRRALDGLGASFQDVKGFASDFATVMRSVVEDALNSAKTAFERATDAVGGWLAAIGMALAPTADFKGDIKSLAQDAFPVFFAAIDQAKKKWQEFREGLRLTAAVEQGARELDEAAKRLSHTGKDIELPASDASKMAAQLKAAADAANVAGAAEATLSQQYRETERAVRSLTASQKSNIEAGLKLGLSNEIIFQKTGVAEEVIGLFKDQLAGAGKEMKALSKASDEFNGRKLAEDTQRAVDALGAVDASTLGNDALAKARQMVEALISEYETAGRAVPEALAKIEASILATVADAKRLAEPVELKVVADVGGDFSKLTREQLLSLDAAIREFADHLNAVGQGVPAKIKAVGDAVNAELQVPLRNATEWANAMAESLKLVGERNKSLAAQRESGVAHLLGKDLVTEAAQTVDLWVTAISRAETAGHDLAASQDEVQQALQKVRAGITQLRRDGQPVPKQWEDIERALSDAAGGADELHRSMLSAGQAAAYAAGTTRKSWDEALDGMGAAFVQLSQVAGGAFGGIAQWIGTTISAMELGKQAAVGMADGFDQASGAFGDGGGGAKDFAAGLVQMSAAAAQAVSAMDAATRSGTRLQRTLAGAATGAQIGQQLAGAWGAVGGAIVGALIGAFRKTDADRAMAEIGKEWGLTISEQLAKTIETTMKSKFAGMRNNRWLAEVFNLGAIIDEVGLTADNISSLMGQLRQSFVFLTEGSYTVRDVAKVLNDSFSQFADYYTARNGLISGSLQEIIKLDRELGVHSKAVADFVSTQAQRAAAGFNKIAQNFLTLVTGFQSGSDDMKRLMEAIDGVTDSVGSLSKEAPEAVRGVVELQNAAKQGAGGKGFAPEFTKDVEKQLKRIGPLAEGAFGALLASGASVNEALSQLGPGLDEIRKVLKATGQQADGFLGTLLGWQNVVSSNKELFDVLSGVDDMLTGLHNSGLLTQETFASLGATITDAFNTLVKQGVSGTDAIALMQPQLQKVWELQQDFGYAVDASTQALLDQAEASGAVGDQFRPATDRMVQAISDLVSRISDFIDVLSGGVPAAAGDAASGIEDQFSNIDIPPIDIRYRYTQQGSGPKPPPGVPTAPDLPQYASGSGGLVDFGLGKLAMLHGREAVLTETQWRALHEQIGKMAPPPVAIPRLPKAPRLADRTGGGVRVPTATLLGTALTEKQLGTLHRGGATTITVTPTVNGGLIFLRDQASLQQLGRVMSDAVMAELRRRGALVR